MFYVHQKHPLWPWVRRICRLCRIEMYAVRFGTDTTNWTLVGMKPEGPVIFIDTEK